MSQTVASAEHPRAGTSLTFSGSPRDL
jgi:hypothetical protein